MKHTFKKIWNLFTTLLVILAVLLAVALVGVRLLGFQVYTVLSGSMEPVYHVGSLIYVKQINPAQVQGCTLLKEGQTPPEGAAVFEYNGQTYLTDGTVLTFMLSENTVATHRVVTVLPDQNDPSVYRFITKGDANETVDGATVHSKNVIGTPVFTIPGLGYAANYIQKPPGTYIALAAGAVLLLLMFIPDIFDEKKD